MSDQPKTLLAGYFLCQRSGRAGTSLIRCCLAMCVLALIGAAQRRKLKVILSCRFLTQQRHRRGQPAPDEAAIFEGLRSYIPKVDRHPALYLHYTYDCPRLEQAAYLLRLNTLLGELAPGHPTFIACNQTPPAVANASKAPTMTWDNFPIGDGSPPGVLMNYRYSGIMDHERELQRIYERTPAARHIQLIQAFDSPGRLRLPTPAELRLQINVGFLGGWTDGVLFYRFHSRTGRRPVRGIVDSKLDWQIASEEELKDICERTRQVGVRLMGSKRRSAALLAVPPILRVAEYEKGAATFALVVNRSATTAFQGEIVVADAKTRKGTAWERLAVLEDVLTGKRFRVTPKQPTRIPVSLRPGDAALFQYGADAVSSRSTPSHTESSPTGGTRTTNR